MRSFNKFLLAGFMTLGLFACSSESDVVTPEEETTTDAVYMSFKLEFPTVGTRSATDSEGTTNSNASPDYEVGLTGENAVTSAYIILAGEDGELVSSQLLEDMGNGVQQNANVVYTVTFQKNDLISADAGSKLSVYAICNPTTEFKNKLNAYASAVYTEATDDNNSEIWGDGDFLMTNAEVATTITVPESWSPYFKLDNPFPLGTIAVERTAARFDYKAGGTSNTTNLYDILLDETSATAKLQVQLDSVALINMSKSTYYLRRVSANGQNTDAELGGKEVPAVYNQDGNLVSQANYVVDTDADKKNGYDALKWSDKTNNFYYNLEQPNTWEFTALSKITKEDNYNGTGDGAGDYHIWRYAIENTIPAGTDNQKNGISTGVVFKGHLVITDENIDNTLPVYVYQNVLYGNLSALAAAATEINADPALYVAYSDFNKDYEAELTKILQGDDTETTADLTTATAEQNLAAEKATSAAKHNFTRYTPEEDGTYDMYYYYWNRHNDNANPEAMGIMEFAVVRNNVYKLAVTSISNFGHPDPTDPGNDPDPVDPDDPDEEKKVYFQVAVKVLPWVVRVNNIEF